jgi:hypothetical protein
MCRFDRRDFDALVQALSIPSEVRAAQRSCFPADKALFITLRRLSYPTRLCDLSREFGISEAQISICVDKVVDIIYNKWQHLLEFHGSRFGAQQLQRFAAMTRQVGCPLGGCVGFIDGTMRPSCRPQLHQRLVFSGHKRQHGLKFQAVVTPDGIISHLGGPYTATRHDAAILAQSGLLQFTEQHFRVGDQYYCISTHIVCPFKGAQLHPDEIAFNSEMAKSRICVEWTFGKLLELFAFLDYKKNLKLYLQPIAKYYVVAALLTNCHTCLYGSLTIGLFNSQAPTLDQPE